MAAGVNNLRWVRCPKCGDRALYAAENPARPFCSLRCRHADLGAWASEDYRVAQVPPTDSDDIQPEPGTTH
jgi:uncharacterized protein